MKDSTLADVTIGTSEGPINSTFDSYHDYTIDWKPDTLTWSIDGQVVRTINKKDTMDSQGVAHYPSTPSLVELRFARRSLNE